LESIVKRKKEEAPFYDAPSLICPD